MKVGDLVTLSAYGQKIKRTSWVKHGDIGIVKNIRCVYFSLYEIMWNKSDFSGKWAHQKEFDRRDLKFVK